VLQSVRMATDIERLSRLMLDEFSRVHEQFGRVHERLDQHDQRFDRIDEELRGMRTELNSIRTDLDDLADKVENILGYRKEIDHLLERIAAIERKLTSH
jgi:uncharacterized coiled-coil DUF342 family protein